MVEFIGIVIKTTPFRDNDLMVTVISSDKIRSFLARGTLKIDSKNAPSVNIYTKSRFAITKGKDGYSLRFGEVLDSYEHTKDDLLKLSVVDLLGELTNKFIQSDDANKIYPFLEKSLELLNSNFDPYSVALIYFAKVLSISGYSLEVDECVKCHQKKAIVALSYVDGGFICQNCFKPLNGEKFSERRLKIIRYIFKVDPERFGQVSFLKDEVMELIEELSKFCYDVTSTEIKSLSLLRKI